MNKMLAKGIFTVAVLGLAHYLYNPAKYNRMAKKLKDGAGRAANKGQQLAARAKS